MGISLRTFEGWTPAEIHTIERDADGRVERIIVTRESEWDDEQRAWILGLAEREAAECRRCGGDLHETLDYQWSWKPRPPSVCLRCVALQAAEKAYATHPQHEAMIHTVVKTPRPQRKKRRRR